MRKYSAQSFDMADGYVKTTFSSSVDTTPPSSLTSNSPTITKASSISSSSTSKSIPADDHNEESEMKIIEEDDLSNSLPGKRKSFSEMTKLFYSQINYDSETAFSQKESQPHTPLKESEMIEVDHEKQDENSLLINLDDDNDTETSESKSEPFNHKDGPPLSPTDESSNKTLIPHSVVNKSGLPRKSRVVPARIDTGISMIPVAVNDSENDKRRHSTSSRHGGENNEKENGSEYPSKLEKRVHFQPQEFNVHEYESAFSKRQNWKNSFIYETEAKSQVKDYIKGENASSMNANRISLVRYKTEDVLELQHDEHRAQPLHPACEKGSSPSIRVKETLASRKRLAKLHQENQQRLERMELESQEYIPPLQRKEIAIKELKRQLQETFYVIQQREMELDLLQMTKQKDIESVEEEKSNLIEALKAKKAHLEKEQRNLKQSHEESTKKLEELEEELLTLQRENAERECMHQEIYLAMYNKGRDTALFEREQELEVTTANVETDAKDIMELIEQIKTAQEELEYWQNIKTCDPNVQENTENTSSQTGPTEAEATLKFLKDALYHFLTDKRNNTEQHILAMVGILNFSQDQHEHIKKALHDKRRKGRL